MSFSRVNPGGWGLFEVLTSSQMNQIDINQSRAVDGFAGGTYTPSDPIEFGGAGVVINTIGGTPTFTGDVTFEGDVTIDSGHNLTVGGSLIVDYGILVNGGSISVDATVLTAFNGPVIFGGGAEVAGGDLTIDDGQSIDFEADGGGGGAKIIGYPLIDCTVHVLTGNQFFIDSGAALTIDGSLNVNLNVAFTGTSIVAVGGSWSFTSGSTVSFDSAPTFNAGFSFDPGVSLSFTSPQDLTVVIGVNPSWIHGMTDNPPDVDWLIQSDEGYWQQIGGYTNPTSSGLRQALDAARNTAYARINSVALWVGKDPTGSDFTALPDIAAPKIRVIHMRQGQQLGSYVATDSSSTPAEFNAPHAIQYSFGGSGLLFVNSVDTLMVHVYNACTNESGAGSTKRFAAFQWEVEFSVSALGK
jgi:hypothetical protein